jgi:hypothetical protein
MDLGRIGFIGLEICILGILLIELYKVTSDLFTELKENK